MKKKTKIVVLMGGKSSEHDISVISGNEVVKNLDKKKYLAIPVVISKEGKGFDRINKNKPDIVFIALHGKFGEDGTVQGMLELLGIPYTGSGVLASSIGMDKLMFRKLMHAEGITSPDYFVVNKNEKVRKLFKPPYFVKPFDGGSSVGVSIVKKGKELENALKLVFRYSETAIVEEFVEGLEVTCGVLGNDNPVALPVTEIHPIKGDFFDYKSKYNENGSEEITPARISKKMTEEVRGLAVKIHKIVGARGFSRVDFILQKGKTPIVLEINTIPGMTPMSLLPKAAAAAGITYPQLLDRIIGFADVK
ncbi:MAG: D-alanine-D-alanine ligase Ddl [Microgenomates group bacterium GW2011_GWC1_41_20]|uniref:D-alanine--D-alanine ligase n=5 Tax=Candidatus Woeseibacteriota TaxID=1752722 RepID=A0A0G0U8L0_9BACT|nr:MAG: D-alanine-D-alanine ligase Ddl [Candidatus Woesebacteria bacterium GW2011_GWB1_40_12]KKR55815.1 MAG: D-alanine-D-alanine ligase Ddl [Candidatus Woesebacteria bacterium GW2011_GWF1_40_24]KKR90256.1 MAG: D-alanine-D-alanine ligase Ddl [Candidatus Woesebacteria bacterium GW2011_GWD1_41_12]KKS00658.1 MAG: D-alanine-D-alanine ligase Ddl [Microgenomates group bacterium GW2011_GWC1_41_20]KKS05242.1 MAG: D-alanine-D-alanine ligase Ddl [Candidatus Woesebacteria bacterium GW2011_GWE1_41_24]OGM88